MSKIVILTGSKNEGRESILQEDDMQLIYEKLTDAEILVTASLVYFYGISAQLKAVVEPYIHR